MKKIVFLVVFAIGVIFYDGTLDKVTNYVQDNVLVQYEESVIFDELPDTSVFNVKNW